MHKLGLGLHSRPKDLEQIKLLTAAAAGVVTHPAAKQCSVLFNTGRQS